MDTVLVKIYPGRITGHPAAISKLLWKCSLNYRQSRPYPAREVATQTSIWFAKVVEPVPVHHNPSTGICNLHSNLRIAFSNMAFGIQLKV